MWEASLMPIHQKKKQWFTLVPEWIYRKIHRINSRYCSNSVFPQNEIDKEIEIIQDEIQSYNDSPSNWFWFLKNYI